MRKYIEMNREELNTLHEELLQQFEEIKARGLKLDMSRGKPAVEQLDMGRDILDAVNSQSSMEASNGLDTRNYGGVDGIPEAKELMAQLMGTKAENVLIFGNSSLNIMFDTVARSITHGVMGNTPWCKLDKVKFLCPAPGYDRHFGVTEYFGIEMITVPMTEQGPDMDMIERLVAGDESIKGLWCVPKYSNPLGITFSHEVVRRFASLKPAAKDFRLFWDNSYCVHDLYEDGGDQLLDIISECEKTGNLDMVYEFASTSKISFAGGGIAAVATSAGNQVDFKKHMTMQTIGYDKINQLRHVRYFRDLAGVKKHMMKHAAIMRPKFEAVIRVLEEELGGLGIGSWTTPRGGYFISFEAMAGCAGDIVDRAKEAGLIMTGAGATFPYKKDHKDSNIRIAPSYPTMEELEVAGQVFVLSVKLVSVEKLLQEQ